MRKFPDINCEIEKTDFNKDAQGAFIEYLKIVQTDRNFTMIGKYFDPYEEIEINENITGRIAALDDTLKIAKLELENDTFRWFDYENKSFNIEKYTKYFHFKINNFKFDNTTLNTLVKFINIALSMATIDNFAFYFLGETQILENKKIRTSNNIRGFEVKTTIYESDDYKELRMQLITPSATLFDIEVGINFLEINQGYVKLCCINELSQMTFDKIRRFFHQNHNYFEI